jgi:hypothetical protein
MSEPVQSIEDDSADGTVKIGAEIWCTPQVAEDVRQRLRDAVDEIVDEYPNDIIDYGRD